MKILIIGSKGFIGQHVVKYFSLQHKIWQCDVVTDYTTLNYSVLDATNANYEELFKEQSFDACINCSGAASVPESIENPQRDFNLNVVNVFKQLDAIRKFNSDCKYINLSSAAVYGNPNYLPIDESHPIHPISPYGHHKVMAEKICEEFYKLYQLKTCSLRIFSAFGAGLQKQLFWDLNMKAKEKTEIELFGTGDESRDFIHVDDVIRAVEIVLHNSEFNADIINVAQGVEVPIKEAVSSFYSLFDQQIKYNFSGEERKGDPVNWVANIDRLKKMGYEPSVNLREGLIKFKAWIDDID